MHCSCHGIVIESDNSTLTISNILLILTETCLGGSFDDTELVQLCNESVYLIIKFQLILSAVAEVIV